MLEPAWQFVVDPAVVKAQGTAARHEVDHVGFSLQIWVAHGLDSVHVYYSILGWSHQDLLSEALGKSCQKQALAISTAALASRCGWRASMR